MQFRHNEGPPGAVELALHTWEMTPEVDDRGYFKLIKHHLIRFAFQQISDANFGQFEPNNILFGLKFSSPAEFQAAGKFEVTLDSAMGSNLSGSFFAGAGEVLEVTPCDQKGKATEPERS